MKLRNAFLMQANLLASRLNADLKGNVNVLARPGFNNTKYRFATTINRQSLALQPKKGWSFVVVTHNNTWSVGTFFPWLFLVLAAYG